MDAQAFELYPQLATSSSQNAETQLLDSLEKVDPFADLVIDLSGTWNWTSDFGSGQCQIPGVWKDYDGVLRFSRSFDLPETGHRLIYRLAFDGVRHACRVRVNGSYLDHHVGASTSFHVNLPERLLRFGSSNQIEIEVDNRLSAGQGLPLKRQGLDEENWGGIYRSISLIAGSRLRVGRFDYTLSEAAPSRKYRNQKREILALQVQVRNLELVRIDQDSLAVAEDLWLRVVLLQDGAELAQTQQDFQLRKLEATSQELVLNVPELKRWSPSDPVQYEYFFELGVGSKIVHQMRQSVGFRSFECRGEGLFLNDIPLRLQGMSYLPEHPDYGLALPLSQLENDLENMRNLGVNLLLHLAGAPDPHLLELCDRVGMLVLSELPLTQVPPLILQSPEMTQLAMERLNLFMNRDHLHPSFMGVSLGSGFDFSDESLRTWMKDLRGRLSQAALVTASGAFRKEKSQQEALVGLDFLLLEHMPGEDLSAYPNYTQPILLSRISHTVQLGNSEGYAHPFSLIRQAYHLQTVMKSTRSLQWQERGEFAGTIVHSYADWLGERPLLWLPTNMDPHLRPVGLFTRDRVARPATRVLKSFYAESSQPDPLTRGEYLPPSPILYPLVGFALLILLLMGYRQNNVFNHNLRRSFVHSQGFFEDIRDKRIYQFGQALFLWLLVSGGLALNLSGAFHLMRYSRSFDHIMGLFLPTPALLHLVRELSWDPLRSLPWLTVSVMALFVLLALCARLLGLLFNARFSLVQAMTFLCWSAACLLLTLPLGIVFNRLMLIPVMQTPTLLLLAFLFFWFLMRLLRTMRIAFRDRFFAAFLLVIIVIALLILLYLGWLERSEKLFEYLEFYSQIQWGSQ
jgi:hypothetical protein